MHQHKKQLEVLLLEYFRKCFSEFPKGSVVASESPDFIVSFKNRQMLGIELTRLNPGNTISLSPEQIAEIILRESFIELARTIFEEHLPHKLFVKFLFSEKNKIEKTQKLMLAVKLASIVREKVNNYHQETYFNILLNSQELPKEIESILIINHPKLKTSVWERSNNLGVSTNVVADIRYAIHKKDEKMRLYQRQRLNYYWLLIFTDRLRGIKSFNLAEKVKNHKYKSKFQHVFLFDLVKSDIYELI